jgi:hypothetical protein
MAVEPPYNAHFELSSTGQVALARSCGAGCWEEWVCVHNHDWRSLAEVLLDGRVSIWASDPASDGRGSRRIKGTFASSGAERVVDGPLLSHEILGSSG